MKKFKTVCASEKNEKWDSFISRQTPIYTRENDIRSPFNRDYTRVIHSTAYRRLKHKTQVFFSPSSDHICTRIEHVNLVESISYTIANELGLNTELTKVISVAHDLGHAPFGHHGEEILDLLCKKYLGIDFWHEKNGLIFVDNLEGLTDDKGAISSLDLTYAVRDGIICHCGEVTENALIPRSEFISLSDIKVKNQVSPYSWEGCVVKLADTISYIGRDIEDALKTNILSSNDIRELGFLINKSYDTSLNNAVIINRLITDLSVNSSPEKGMAFSEETYVFLKQIKQFNLDYIYKNPRMIPSNNYTTLVINTIFETLFSTIKEGNESDFDNIKRFYPKLYLKFSEYIRVFLENTTLMKSLGITRKEQYIVGIIYYICGMTDNYAIEVFDEIVRF